MVVGRRAAHAHEFLGADLDHRHARIVMEMRDDVVRHGSPLEVMREALCGPHHSEVDGPCLEHARPLQVIPKTWFRRQNHAALAARG